MAGYSPRVVTPVLALLVWVLTVSCTERDPVNGTWSVQTSPSSFRWENRCDTEEVQLALADDRGRVQSEYVVPLEGASQRKTSHWDYEVDAPGTYSLRARVTSCDGEIRDFDVLTVRIDQAHDARFVRLVLNDFEGQLDIAYAETSAWSSGEGFVEIVDGSRDSFTIRNLSEKPLRRCVSAPVVSLEYELEGSWGFHGQGYSFGWPASAAEVGPNETITLERPFHIAQIVPGAEEQRPGGKRYLVFREPAGKNNRVFERYRELGYTAEGSGCDVYYLELPVVETDPDLVPSEPGNYNY